MKQVTLLIGILVLVGCYRGKDIEKIDNTQALIKPSLLINHLYILSISFDSINCQAYGECDCCSSLVYFLDDSTFIREDLCLFDDLYYKGKYKIDKNQIIFNSESIFVSVKFLEEEETYTDTTASISDSIKITTEKGRPYTTKWTLLECRDKLCFKNSEKEMPFVSQDILYKQEFLENLKTYKINQLLNIEN